MKFNLRETPNHIGVEDQNLVVQFAHVKKVDGVWQNQTYFSECRDFMGDAIYAMEIQQTVEIYGFVYDPKTHPLRTDRCSIGIRFPDKETQERFGINLPMITKLGIKPTYVSVNYDKLITIVSFNKIWLKTTFGISYLTFLLKCCCYELDLTKDLFEQISTMTYKRTCTWSQTVDILPIKEAKYVKDTRQYIDKLNPVIESIMKKQGTVHGIVGTEVNTNRVHNDTGFYSTFKWKKTEPYNLFKEQEK